MGNTAVVTVMACVVMASGAGKTMVTQCSCGTCCGKHPWWNLPQGTGTIVRSLRLEVGCENRQAAKIKDVLEEWWGAWMLSTGPRGLSLCSLPHDASRMPFSLSHDAQHALIKPGCPCGFDGCLPQRSLENRKFSAHFWYSLWGHSTILNRRLQSWWSNSVSGALEN